MPFRISLGYNVPMQRARILLVFSIWIAVLPYLGFPTSWKNFLFTLTGLVLAYLSYVLYKEYRINKIGTTINIDSFSENRDFEAKEDVVDSYGERN